MSGHAQGELGHISDAMLEQIVTVGLPESEMRQVQEHLQSCALCRARLNEVRQEQSEEPE
ncbi:MAG TPA: hypothetical protein VFA33_17845 [Bryobacteraceae bacterium]|nr:hypothetical protein [Bryobacteraceae bacterium]